jgi:hypothetical protein
VAQDRLRLLDDGHIVLTLKTPWADGTRQLVFEPLELLEKLAALIPRPRINLVLYHGVLAPHAGWRARVVAYRAPRAEGPVVASAAPEADDEPAPIARHWRWADLMRRAFALDVLACRRSCGGSPPPPTGSFPRAMRSSGCGFRKLWPVISGNSGRCR